jgi:chaperonin cofactor prefoldin
VNLTLRGALARVALQDLERQRDSTQRRIDLLEQQTSASRTFAQQLTATLRVLWAGVSGSAKP